MMIRRSTLATLSPCIYEELIYRQSVTWFNKERELRKPLGIYNLSLNAIWESFSEVVDELDQVLQKQQFRQEPPDARWDKVLMRRQERLISDLMRHFDDCFNLLMCFYPVRHSRPEEDKKMVMKEPAIKATMQAIEPYRDRVANIMNHIKHQQGALRGVVIFNDNIAIPGYFVEHVDQREVVEPHPNVHQVYQGQSTAFSFFRDVRLNFWLVYAVAEIVADTIRQLSQQTPNVYVDNGTDTTIARLAQRIASMPKSMFKDEVGADFPEIEVENAQGATFLTLEYPSTRTIIPALSGNYKVACMLKVIL